MAIPAPTRGSSRTNLRPTERTTLFIIGALLLLRALYLFTHGVDSDEPQNLHVVYQWAHGYLPYRDTFDNHTPLFHALFLPFIALIGENANIIVLVRLALVPLSFGILGLIYILFRQLFDRTVALWSLAVTLALADWSLKSIEFRPDVLWAFLWFAALLVLVRPDLPVRPRTFFLAGILLGASAAASVKTVFLLPALAVGWGAAWAFSASFRQAHPWSIIWRCLIASVLGFAIVPAAVAAFFAAQGALPDMLRCIYSINKDPFLTERSWIFFAAFPFSLALAAWISFRPRSDSRSAYRSAVFLTAATYTLLIIGFAPFEALAKQTFLPAYPLLLAAACQLVLTIRPWRDWQINALGGTACGGLTIAMLIGSPPLADGTAPQRELLAAIIEHTNPGDTVMDLKGETLFRRRPVYLAYVGNTSRAMEAGDLPAPDPARLRVTATAYAVESTSSLPEAMQNFIRENYLSTTGNQLRVAGKILKPSFDAGHWIERTPVAIPGSVRDRRSRRINDQPSHRDRRTTGVRLPRPPTTLPRLGTRLALRPPPGQKLAAHRRARASSSPSRASCPRPVSHYVAALPPSRIDPGFPSCHPPRRLV